MSGGLLLLIALAYLALLFAIASWADRRSPLAERLVRAPATYALSLAVYCTAWTFYGSVGLAASGGLAFLPVYLGPSIAAALTPFVVFKMLRITKANGITSIADFIAARYAKSGLLAGLVTIAATLAVIPYLALQLKAVTTSAAVLLGPEAGPPLGLDPALLVALVLAGFAILFGARHIDATEQHAGMVVAVAFESLVKLAAFLLVGIAVTWGVLGGPWALVERIAAAPELAALLTVSGAGLTWADWALLSLLSGLAFLLLPRQFQVAVIENQNEAALHRAAWLLPLYLLLINLFVVPVALAGLVQGIADPDTSVIAVPLGQGWQKIALVAFLGGLSAATAMVIVETIALATMISNDLVVPALLRIPWSSVRLRTDAHRAILAVRRASILVVLLAAYLFFLAIGGQYRLASIGFIAFTGIAQFAPALLLGMYWKDANLPGAVTGLAVGLVVWLYTLVLPALAETGLFDPALLLNGPWGLTFLRPGALFGLAGLHPAAHALVWSLGANLVLFVLVSLLLSQSPLERLQAQLYLEAQGERGAALFWRGRATVGQLTALLQRFVGEVGARALLAADARRRGLALGPDAPADAELAQATERRLARVLGAASARVVVGQVVQGEQIGPAEVMEILDETSQVLETSRRLAQKSRELEAATEELRRANERLRELDRLKDDFMATVSHELRTPLTSIRSFSEILLDVPDIGTDERERFLSVIVRESERLTRLIDDILDAAKIESGTLEWRVGEHDLRGIASDAAAAIQGLLAERGVALETRLPDAAVPVTGDRDRLVQVVVNLLSNAAKFVEPGRGRIALEVTAGAEGPFLRVADNGPGIAPEHRDRVFEKFHQVSGSLKDRPKGTGLGLTICRQIVEHFGGRIWVEDSPLGGAAFCFVLPRPDPAARAAA